MCGLGPKLLSSQLGITLQPGLCISTIFFADDIVLISLTPAGMDVLFDIAMKYFAAHRLTLSISKSKMMSRQPPYDRIEFSGDFPTSPVSLETVVTFKYLGVTLSSRPRSLFKDFNDRVQAKVDSYHYSILSLVRSGPERSHMALTLWKQVALPSILYGSEVIFTLAY